jgi:molybdate transport system regulatory protein
MPTASTTPGPKLAIRPRVKLWLECSGESVFCRGLCDILRAVDETGSIKHAAAEVGRSYRFVWARIKEAEGALGTRLVDSHVGGRGTHRSELTPLARDLVNEFDGLREAVFELVDNVFAQRLDATLQRHRQADA